MQESSHAPTPTWRQVRERGPQPWKQGSRQLSVTGIQPMEIHIRVGGEKAFGFPFFQHYETSSEVGPLGFHWSLAQATFSQELLPWTTFRHWTSSFLLEEHYCIVWNSACFLPEGRRKTPMMPFPTKLLGFLLPVNAKRRTRNHY